MNHMKRAKALGKGIKNAFKQFGAEIDIVGIKFIHSLLRYIFEISISPGTSVQAIMNHSEDIQIALGFPLFYPFKDGIHIRIAVSEYNIKENSLLKILRSSMFTDSDAIVPYAIGYDLWGGIRIVDLVELRHLLIAGPTGTGKSVALQCLILSIIVSCPISSVNLLLFDIGGGSLSLFGNLPHLSHPIVEDAKTGIRVLDRLVTEMFKRLALNETELQCLPFLVCIMDEFVSTITNIVDKREQETFINLMNSLLRMGRKAKIITVLATHNPTLKNAKVDLSEVVARISFQSAKHHNSSTALGIVGAEKLSGAGAMIFKSQKGVQHLHGSFVEPKEIEKILSNPPIGYDDSNMFIISKSESEQRQALSDTAFYGNTAVERDTKELANIILWVLGRENISANQIQKNFHIGNRASSIVDEMYQLGIVTKKFANQPRKVIPRGVEDLSPEVIEILSKNEIPIDTLTTRKEQAGK